MFALVVFADLILSPNFNTLGDLLGAPKGQYDISLKSIFFFILLIIVIIWVIQGVFYRQLRKFLGDAINCVETNSAPKRNVIPVVVFFFIFGILGLLSIIYTVCSSLALREIADGLKESLANNPDFSKYANSFSKIGKINVLQIIAMVINSILYILSAVLAMQYTKISSEIITETSNNA